MKVVACFGPGIDDHAAVAGRMAQAQSHAPRQRCRVFPVAGGALACVSGPEQVSPVPLMKTGPQGNVLLVSGVPIDLHGSLDNRLDDSLASNHQQAGELLSHLDGAFAALFWDAANLKLLVVTDIFGMQPLHLYRRNNQLLLATELKAFGASGLVDVQMGRAGWGSFFSLGFTIGHHTQLDRVHRLAGGTVLTRDALGRVEEDRHWRWPDRKPCPGLTKVDTGQLVDIVRQEVRAYKMHVTPGVLLMSGGFDSRLLAAVLGDEGIPARALILAHSDERKGMDGRLARRAARKLLGTEPDFIESPPGFYDSHFYLQYLGMNEVAIPSLGLFIAQVSKYLTPAMGAVWEGVGPGFVFAAPFPEPGGFEVYRRARSRPLSSPQWQAVLSVFRKDLGEAMWQEYDEALQAEFARYSDDEFGVSEFQTRNQMVHRLGLSPMCVFANSVLPFTPCLSRACWDLAANLPLAIRGKQRFYLHVLGKHYPKAVSVAFCSGGKLYGRAGPRDGRFGGADLRAALGKCVYYANRLRGKTPRRRGDALVEAVVRKTDPGHLDLCADRVAAIQRSRDSQDWLVRLSRTALFYWQTWRWVMEGSLTTQNAAQFMESLGRPSEETP